MNINNISKKFCFVSEKRWHKALFENLSKRHGEEWYYFDHKKDFSLNNIAVHNFDKIFIPHWSYIIPEEIFSQFECILFHMTDLPYGRGGSPLQNLIVRKHIDTKISAIRVSKGIDTGLIYLKEFCQLNGTAEEIFIRSSNIIEGMISMIIDHDIKPKPQEGEPTIFKRRKPEDGNIEELVTLEDVYDFIRMLDCEGYPKAFLETKNLKLEFKRASLKSDNSIIADVKITRK